MSKASPRYKTALFTSLAVHLLVLLCGYPLLNTPPEQKKPREQFIELSFGEDTYPEPLPEPAPAPIAAPEPLPEAPPKPQPKVTPRVSARPQESAPPEATSEAPSETATPDAEPSGAGVGVAGEDPGLASGKEGKGAGVGKGTFDPRAKISLYSLGGVVDAPGPKKGHARKSFVTAQAGGAGVSVSSVIAGNHRELGKVKKVFVGYLRKMHEQLHKTWAEGALKDFELIDCDQAVSDVNLEVTLEIVLLKDGSLEKATPIVSSGVTEFDVAAVGAFFDAAPFPKPPSFIYSYDGKVYIHWILHRDGRQCGSTYAQAYILTNDKGESASQPTSQEFSEEEEALLAETEKSFPTLPVSRGFAKELVSAVSKMGENCREKLKMLRDSIKEDGLVRTLIRERFKNFIPPDVSEEGFIDFLKTFKPTPFCRGTPAYVFAEEPSKGPADELSFPVGQCDPSCRDLCFTF